MLNKKIILISAIIGVLVILGIVLFSIFSPKTSVEQIPKVRETEKKIVNEIGEDRMPEAGEIVGETKDNQEREKVIKKVKKASPKKEVKEGEEKLFFEEFEEKHPELSSEQLDAYLEIATNSEEVFNRKEVDPCIGRDDEYICRTSVAFIKGDVEFCHNYDEEEEEAQCARDVLQLTSEEKVSQCQVLSGDDFFNCLMNIFNVFNQESDCVVLQNKVARNMCEEVFNYEEIYLKYDRALCANLKNDKLKQYCLKNILTPSPDTDNDGLSDEDETRYGTDINNPDTDGDGYKDGEEVQNGYNPLGPGKL